MLEKQILRLGNTEKMFLPQVKNIFASRTQHLASETYASQFSQHENNVD